MNNFDEWSQIISRFLKAEADLLTSVAKHDIAADSTRSAFIRGVLEPFLPSSYAIGSGRVIDSSGNSSDQIDIVIYRRDFPRLNLPGSSDVFLYESVLATIEVRTKLIRKTLFDALDTCASIAKLNPDISEQVLKNIATQNKLTLNNQNKFVHEHPLLTDRFNLIGRPPSFIYGFNGFQTSPSQLNDNINIWLDARRENNLRADLNSFPAVIATQGCVGWRNAAPLSANNNHLFGIGADAAPIRLIILQLLYQLNKRLKVTPDGQGLKPNVDSYLNKMAPPEIQHTAGKATNAATSVAKPEMTAAEVRKTRAPAPAVTKAAAVRSQPTAESKPVPQARPAAEPKPVTAAKISEPKPVVESKPTPSASATAETKPAEMPKPAPVQKTTAEPKPAVASKPAPEPKPVEKPNRAAEPKPTPEADSLFDSKPVFESEQPAKPIASPLAKAAADTTASSIPKPSLGAMFHADPTLAEMPVPDASLVPEPKPEPEAESFIETTPASQPLKTKVEKKSAPEPEADADADPFIQTMRMPGAASKSAAEAKPAASDKTDFEIADDDPFLQTVRIPASAMPASEPKSDPFSRTIPGLQDPPKSVH
jgi:hypothetical protein